MEAGVAPRPAMELDNIEAAKKMVEEGLGVALLPRMSVGRELALVLWCREVPVTDRGYAGR